MNFTLISIVPWEQVANRPRQSPVKVHKLEAAPLDGFVRYEITDQLERDYLGGGRMIDQIVKAEELAYDLAKEFTMLHRGDSGELGVFVMPGSPTDAEVLASPQYADARRLQDQLMHNIVIEARHLFSTEEGKKISMIHRNAAAYLNIEGEEWQGKNRTRSATKECPFCSSFVSSSASVCPICTKVINPEAYVKIEAEIKAQVDALKQQENIAPDNGGSALRPASKKPALAGA